MENIDEINLPLPFDKLFGLTSGAFVRDTVSLILMRKSLSYFNCYSTREDVHATNTYFIILPSSNDVIYFLSKNNTQLSFPSIKQWCELISFQNHQATMSFIFLLNNTCLSFPSINNDVNYTFSKEKITWIMS